MPIGLLPLPRTRCGPRRHPGRVTAATCLSAGFRRVVSTRLEIEVVEEADLVLAIAVSYGHTREAESLLIRDDAGPVAYDAIDADHETRLHLRRDVVPGMLVIDYEATVCGQSLASQVLDLDRVRYLRPSRYCESDRLGPLARDEFAGLRDHQLLAGVSS